MSNADYTIIEYALKDGTTGTLVGTRAEVLAKVAKLGDIAHTNILYDNKMDYEEVGKPYQKPRDIIGEMLANDRKNTNRYMEAVMDANDNLTGIIMSRPSPKMVFLGKADGSGSIDEKDDEPIPTKKKRRINPWYLIPVGAVGVIILGASLIVLGVLL